MLKKAKALIADKSKWTQKVMGRNAAGEECEVNVACQFCALGALLAVCGGRNMEYSIQKEKLYTASMKLWFASPINVNDEMGWEKVMEMYDEALLEECCSITD
jgi:hypothetical protein